VAAARRRRGTGRFPRLAPVRYLLLTHWGSADELNAWLDSAECKALDALGEVTSQVSVLIRHRAGEREGLTAGGSLRGWSRHAAPVAAPA
jgi:heme-degrading monooxygenase HmoA